MTATIRPGKHRVNKQLELFSLRCFDLAARVTAGGLPFIEAVDLAYSAAVWADLPNTIDKSDLIDRNKPGSICGDDIVQQVMAAAFANARGPA
jgi:hypothetical protein